MAARGRFCGCGLFYKTLGIILVGFRIIEYILCDMWLRVIESQTFYDKFACLV